MIWNVEYANIIHNDYSDEDGWDRINRELSGQKICGVYDTIQWLKKNYNLLLKNNMKTLLWLDDIRDPKGYVLDGNTWESSYSPIQSPFKTFWVKSYDEFTKWIKKNGLPDAICFDHDLGMEVAVNARFKGMSKRKSRQLKKEEKTGYDCAKWLIEYCLDNYDLPIPLYNIQSANPVGKENIDSCLKHYMRHLES
jgi:hypothetical protein